MVSADGSGVGILISPERRTVKLRMLKGTASRDGVESLGLADGNEVTPVRLLYRSNSTQQRRNVPTLQHTHVYTPFRDNAALNLLEYPIY